MANSRGSTGWYVLAVFRMAINLPVLLPYWFIADRRKLDRDIERWCEIYADEIHVTGRISSFLYLFSRLDEFRSLFYFRAKSAGAASAVLSMLFRKFYRGSPSLFINRHCEVGEGLFLQHGFSTIVDATIGKDCWINQQVTIGYKDDGGIPTIGDNVHICAGAKVLGNIKVGNNVVIGANAVVVKDVPDNCVVGGVPAKIIRRTEDPASGS